MTPTAEVKQKRPRLTDEQIKQAKEMANLPGNTVKSVALFFGVGETTLKKKLGLVKVRESNGDGNGHKKVRLSELSEVKEASLSLIRILESQAQRYEEASKALRDQVQTVHAFLDEQN